MNYNWNIRNWVAQYINPIIRTDSVVALFYSFCKPVANLYSDFNTKRTEINYRLMYNSQQLSLQALLNEKYDSLLNRIVVETFDDLISRVYLPEDNAAPIIRRLYLGADNSAGNPFLKGDAPGAGYADIIISVPADVLAVYSGSISAEVNYYRIAGKSFTLKSI